MKRIRYWLASKKLQMAQLHDLQRQWQEMRDERDKWESSCYAYYDKAAGLLEQLHRVARERDQERKKRIDAEMLTMEFIREKRLEAEDRLLDRYLENAENEEV